MPGPQRSRWNCLRYCRCGGSHRRDLGARLGLSFQAPAAWPVFAARFLAGELPSVPELGTPALSLRMLCDDIKALYGEAAQAEGPAPSAHQIDAWFWRETVAGRLLVALRTVAIASEDNALKTVGGRFFVPTHWLPWSRSLETTQLL